MRRLRVPWRAPRLWVRLALGFGALLGLMVLVVVLAVFQFRALAAQGEQLMAQGLHRMLRVQEIHQHAQGHGHAMVRLLTAPRAEREVIYPVVDAEYAEGDRLLADLAPRISDPEESRRLAAVVERRGRYREIFAEVVTWIESDEVQRARWLFNQQAQPALTALLDASSALLAHEQAVIAERQRATHAQIRRSEWLLAGLAAGALGLSVLLAWRTTISLARPLGRVEAAARRIAAGDYAGRVQVRGGDELAKVAQAMNAMATAVAARESEIQRLAYSDRLTGLPNRTSLRRLAADLPGGKLGVMLLDVARLRTVNEVLGFDTGDALLVQVAERLRGATRPGTDSASPPLLARLAGGVFAVLCAGCDRAALQRLRESVALAMQAPMHIDGHVVDVDLVCGLAAGGEAGDASVDGLLRAAELAVGEAKRTKQPWAWHVPVDRTARSRQLSLLSSLRSAAADGELEMWLQPKQCLRSGRTLGMEGLVRWRHPERGYVSPAEFIPFAERTGHIGVVTQAMVEAALRRLADWRPDHPELSIAINVSALDIQDPAFAARIESTARRLRAPLARLRLEITESSLMEDADRALPGLRALRELGVKLSIDDFGTGYSSLAYLHRLPVDELKIDRSFVAGADQNDEACALLRTIVDLGHSLGMCVTAEGIERPQELALLSELGCDLAQGYLISRPLDPLAAAAFVEALPTSAEQGAVDCVLHPSR